MAEEIEPISPQTLLERIRKSGIILRMEDGGGNVIKYYNVETDELMIEWNSATERYLLNKFDK